MAYTTINKSSLQMDTKLYTGTGSELTISGIGFQPDFTWLKNRSSAQHHQLYDVVRGAGKVMYSNLTNAEGTVTEQLKSWTSDGYVLGTDGSLNTNSENFASWNWKANGAGSSNTDGTITSTVSANPTAGFSIAKYTGTGSNASFGHGLGVMPDIVIIKRMDTADNWIVMSGGSSDSSPYQIFGSYDYYLPLSSTGAGSGSLATGDNRASTNSSTTYFNIGTDAVVNASGGTYIAYCFANISGYSKMGRYSGSGSTNGAFVYTGFKPSFILTKRMESTAHWYHWDNKRIGFNPSNYILFPAQNGAEDAGATERIDFLSNGFKFRHADSDHNGDAGDYFYMAFGQTMVGTNDVPATAR